jgi:K+/H+ antiporter YhaU regulatory subunit KhtT
MTVPRRMLGEIGELRALEVETFLVRAEHWACNSTIADLHLFAAGGFFVVALGRVGKTQSNPRAFETLRAGDVVYMVLDGGRSEAAQALLEKGPEAA